MIKPSYITERLADHHDLSRFDCGVEELSEWLHRFALSDQKASVSVTYVLEDAREVRGFYTLAVSSIEPEQADARLGKGLPQRRRIPVTLLARLGVDVRSQGAGHGARLLRDALLRCMSAADSVGSRAVIVEAKDATARAFYQRYGFVSLPEDANMLYRMMKDIRASAEVAFGS